MLKQLSWLGVIAAGLVTCTGADWTGYRGSDSSGVATDTNLPTTLNDKENIAWTVDIPGHGLSCPIVAGNKVFISASEGFREDKLTVMCLDAATGKTLWKRSTQATGNTMTYPYPMMANATPTPVTDGKYVFALFSSNDLVCYDLDGNLQWFRGLNYDYPQASNSIGMSSSLIYAANTLVAQIENDSDSFVAGINPATGANVWKTERPKFSNWNSPAIVRGATSDEDLVVLLTQDGLSLLQPKTGEIAWTIPGTGSTVSSPAVHAGTIYAPLNGLIAVKPTLGSKAPEGIWTEKGLGGGSSSPVIYEGKVYAMGRGVLTGGDAATGKVTWKKRMPTGQYWSTPIAANGHLYVFNADGYAVVLDIRGEGEPPTVSEFQFKDELFLATPAVADNAMYVRTHHKLRKFAKTAAAASEKKPAAATVKSGD